MRNLPIPARLAAMRPSRLVIVGLAGLLALHVFMLAGHGHGHDPFAGMRGEVEHDAVSRSPSLSDPMAGDQASTGVDMTVTCLAVVAGLLLLRPRQRHQSATNGPARLLGTGSPAHCEQVGRRTRSLEELCISLT
jgi:hypothetical protein